ncbi:hypothetical protein ACWC0C_39185 [Streptomyces sp. NPDC001709]
MTDRLNRQFDRAVRAYMRENPRTSLEQAREAVTARASQQALRPSRLPCAPLPRPREALPDYVKRVAAALGTHRHQAMEVLGLQPGSSAGQRLSDLSGGLPEDTVRALCAATGMTPAQARALAFPAARAGAPCTTRPVEETVRRILNDKSLRRGGEGKTSTSGHLVAALARTPTPRVLMVDHDRQRSLEWPGPAPSPWILLDMPPSTGPLPGDPALFDAIVGGLDDGLPAAPDVPRP